MLFETDVAILDKEERIHWLTKDLEDVKTDRFQIINRIIRFNRMLSMQERGWKINNRVYSLVSTPEAEVCDVCKIHLISDRVIKLNCCGLHFYKECFANHVKVQYETKVVPQCGNLECKDREWNF